MSVRVEQLDFSYPRLPALRGIEAQAQAGRIAIVIGPNAAGKSTLLRCIIGALRPQQGRVEIDGRAAHELSARQLSRLVAYVPQRSTVSAAFTVRQVVELGRYALPANTAKVDDAIQRLDLRDVVDRPYAALSVGQQQRVMLARALAQLSDKGVLILDEPTSAMDLRHAHDTVRLMRSLADGGATVIAALHDLTLAATIADDIWLLEAGRLRSAGPRKQVLQPVMLRDVFSVEFEWISSPGRPQIRVANPHEAADHSADRVQ